MMIPKTVYLHVGKHKTGSSSIQHYTYQNRDYLSEKGYRVIDNSIAGVIRAGPANCINVAHIILRSSLKTPVRIRGRDSHRKYLQKITSAMAINKKLHQCRASRILLSAEAFSFARTLPEKVILKTMFQGFHLKPILFVRNKEDWLESWKTQLQNLQNTHGIVDPPLEGIFDFRPGSWLVDDRAIARFYGNNTVVISYEKALMESQSVIPCYLKSVGLCPDECPGWEEFWYNRTVNKKPE